MWLSLMNMGRSNTCSCLKLNLCAQIPLPLVLSRIVLLKPPAHTISPCYTHSPGVLTCESVPQFNEGELDQLFTECNNQAMRELYTQLDNEFMETTGCTEVLRDASPPRGLERDVSPRNNMSDSDSDTLSAHSTLNCSAPIAEQYVNHVTLLNKPLLVNQPQRNTLPCLKKQRSQENQTLSLPFRLIKFLPVEPYFANRKGFSHDISNDISLCKGVQVDCGRNGSLTNQEELYILDRETQKDAQRISLLQSHNRSH